ncbi:MAG TPA: hypothetical protein PLQ13_11380, partial [Candidatus Krumholzibacteria bacterium]|nr:hypothetical protein [Candidatus Krumholzibacteria bacterium]
MDVLSAEAPWRVSFAFEENLDNEAWNYTRLPDELFRPVDGVFNGHGKVRQSRTRLVRSLDRENRLAVEFSNARLTRNDVPAWNADQREIWDTGVAAVMDGAGGAVRWHAVAHWRDRDVQWSQLDDRGGLVAPRKVETGREGLILELQPRGAGRDSLGRAPAAPLSALRFVYDQWAVADRADTLGARPIDLLGEDGRGRHVLAEARTGRRFGGSRGEVALRGV